MFFFKNTSERSIDILKDNLNTTEYTEIINNTDKEIKKDQNGDNIQRYYFHFKILVINLMKIL